MQAVTDRVSEVFKEVVEWRRHLHANPELSYHEGKTSQFIYDTLVSIGGLEVTRPTKYSVMAKLKGGQPGPVLGIHAHMNALPIKEDTGLDYKSTVDGVMHACGHDGHTAMLLGTVKILLSMREQIKGEVRFFFQHAEGFFSGGAPEVVEEGGMEGVDTVIAAHLIITQEVGTFGIAYGPTMAAPDGFYLTVKGKCDAGIGMPHDTIDSIAIGAQVVTNLQQVISNTTNPLEPAMLSIGKFIGGEAMNVIVNSVEISATIRTFNKEVREEMPTLIERVVKDITEAHGATYELEYLTGYEPVINDYKKAAVMENVIIGLYGEECFARFAPNMWAQDFSAFMRNTPGCYFFIGAGNKEKGIVYPHHHPKFDIDEEGMRYAMEILVEAVFAYNNV
ncbi:amidohydrolase [Solibacillus sp. FSL H8-0538]|uniref:amidohydrolase n=1 Tax=Solibacillus sp. FSL H8-0538 TaxID=2921400 RepID=UPI0030F5D730